MTTANTPSPSAADKPSDKTVKAVQKWMLDMCADPKTCNHSCVTGTKDGLGDCEECWDHGVFNLSAKEIASYAESHAKSVIRGLAEEAEREARELSEQIYASTGEVTNLYSKLYESRTRAAWLRAKAEEEM